MRASSEAVHLVHVPGLINSVNLLQHLCYGQSLSAFCAPGSKHVSAAFSLHALHKTMSALAVLHFRLVGPFHEN